MNYTLTLQDQEILLEVQLPVITQKLPESFVAPHSARCPFSLALEISPDLAPFLFLKSMLGHFFLQRGIYILQSLTRHTNLFSWIAGCSLTNTVICQVSGKAMSIGAYTVCMSSPCFQFCGIIFAPHQTTQGHSWILAE